VQAIQVTWLSNNLHNYLCQQVMYLSLLVCPSVCLSVCQQNSYGRIFMKFWEDTSNNQSDFGCDLDRDQGNISSLPICNVCEISLLDYCSLCEDTIMPTTGVMSLSILCTLEMCGIDFLFRFGFLKKTLIRFGISFVWCGSVGIL